MRRTTRRRLILLAVALALGLAVFVQVRREQQQWPAPLTALDTASISTIRLSCPSCVTQRYERVDGDWWMREPRNQAANPKHIEGLLGIANAAVRSRRLLADLDPRKLGLQPAQALLQLDQTQLAFGHLDSIDGDRYVRVDQQDSIARVPDRFSQFLFATP